MLILLVIVVSAAVLFASAGSLLLLSKWFKMPEPTYKKSLLICVYVGVLTGVVGFIENSMADFFGGGETSIITTLVCIAFFHFLFEKYYQARRLKTLAILAAQVVITLLVSGLLIVMVRAVLVTPFYVQGDSMQPAYADKDYLLLNKIGSHYKRSDVIVYREDNNFKIRRIIGLPGETVEMVAVPTGQYLVLPDNRGGNYELIPQLVNESQIIGKVFYVRRGPNFTTVASSTEKKFTSSKYGYTFMYPAQLALDQQFIEEGGADLIAENTNFSVTTVPADSVEGNVFRQQNVATNPGFKKITNNGIDAYQTAASGTSNYWFINTWIYSDKWVYNLQFSTPEQDPSVIAIYNRIVESFTLVK